MEKLRSYLQGRRKGEFAERIGTKPSYLSQILSKRRTPSFKLMCRIEKETGGQVPVSAWADSVEDAA